MIVGLGVWELQLPGCRSLKDKRSVLKSVKDRLHNRFNVSVAETKHHDVHQHSELAVVVVSVDQPHANSVITAVDRFLEMQNGVRIADSYTAYY